ncbi:mechanosensitive ion channel [Nodosilinea sp. LEGE 07088]|uniref:mechanosensitive ion channel family protein n=1 Tax=Nodosilinea sp. LEGE 07088 TaxID=2777968 RepID=UPI0018825732|nr:mechanosensitive ion channel domain-containing protein [Nodosilinea sp. LEGE 07088]MBE9138498.1 mechanosensitive ion channel [Nodosilinea sp. LEGE 07088]
MAIQDIIREVFLVDAAVQQRLLEFGQQIAIFMALIVISLLVGRLIPLIIQLAIHSLAPADIAAGYRQIIGPYRRSLANTIALVLIALNLKVLEDFPGLLSLFNFLVYLALALNAGWLLSRLLYQIIRLYGVKIVQRFNHDADDFILVVESLINATIIFFGMIFFAQSQNLNLISVLAGLGVVGLAVSFAARETIAQVIGSIVLYLDRPYLPGEYVRVSFNPKDEDVYGRVESIGIRSTKIRVAGKNTLVIAPNSLMVAKDIENISRGSKVMALLYLDFPQPLRDQERALAREVIEASITGIYGVEPLSAKVALYDPEGEPGSRARVSFFLLSSGQNSLSLRKRLVDVAKEDITQRLAAYSLQFVMQEPMLYVNSPVTR